MLGGSQTGGRGPAWRTTELRWPADSRTRRELEEPGRAGSLKASDIHVRGVGGRERPRGGAVMRPKTAGKMFRARIEVYFPRTRMGP